MSSVLENRKRMIADLESEEFKQGRQMLYRTFDKSFCCIGVCLSRHDFYQGHHINSLAESGSLIDFEYATFKEMVDADDKLVNHLVLMNDGSSPKSSKGREVTRDFKFIAKFLRKVWGI